MEKGKGKGGKKKRAGKGMPMVPMMGMKKGMDKMMGKKSSKRKRKKGA